MCRKVSSIAPELLLFLVATVFLALQLVVVAPHLPLEYDEAIYLSQVSGHAPPATFSAPRARGIAYLAAPVAMLTSSVAVLRVYFAVLSAVALFGAYLLWLQLRRSRAIPLAALLFSGLWTTQFYGSAAMPNLWLALCAVAATALAVLVGREPRRLGRLAALAAVLAGSALIRPTDSAFLACLLALGLLWRLRRQGVGSAVRPLLAVVAGEAAGWAQWVAEAELRFGGTLNRLTAGARIQGSEPTFSLLRLLRSVNSPIQCMPCDASEGISVLESGLWITLAVLACAGLALAGRRALTRPLLLVTAAAGGLTFTYVFLVPFSAPRFLLPAYALLALPSAVATVVLPGCVRRKGVRKALAGGLAVGVLGYLATQQIVLSHIVHKQLVGRGNLVRAADELERQGVRAPCLITGSKPIEVAYLLGCESTFGKPVGMTRVPNEVVQALGTKRVAAVANEPAPAGSFLAEWTRIPLGGGNWAVYLPPTGE
jgi:hypothetical protein